MNRLALAWTTQNTELGISCFSEDAIYMQPPSEQLFIGHEQLRPYFNAVAPGTVMEFHHLWYDHETQQGAAEFTFGNKSEGTGVTGVTIVKLEQGKIKEWREYFIDGPFDFKEFISTEGKTWKWTIENYP